MEEAQIWKLKLFWHIYKKIGSTLKTHNSIENLYKQSYYYFWFKAEKWKKIVRNIYKLFAGEIQRWNTFAILNASYESNCRIFSTPYLILKGQGCKGQFRSSVTFIPLYLEPPYQLCGSLSYSKILYCIYGIHKFAEARKNNDGGFLDLFFGSDFDIYQKFKC